MKDRVKRDYINNQLRNERWFRNGKPHGVWSIWGEDGRLGVRMYYLYGRRVSEGEYKKEKLIETLAGI